MSSGNNRRGKEEPLFSVAFLIYMVTRRIPGTGTAFRICLKKNFLLQKGGAWRLVSKQQVSEPPIGCTVCCSSCSCCLAEREHCSRLHRGLCVVCARVVYVGGEGWASPSQEVLSLVFCLLYRQQLNTLGFWKVVHQSGGATNQSLSRYGIRMTLKHWQKQLSALGLSYQTLLYNWVGSWHCIAAAQWHLGCLLPYLSKHYALLQI